MLYTDAETQPSDNLFINIHTINPDLMLKIQKDVEPYDMVSLVFLLYDVPDTALQRLIVYQRVSKDVETNTMNLLYDWALYAQSRPTWRYEFLEALTICRLYNIIRKLGFDVSSIKKHYLPENIHVTIYIDPMKKLLYKICENMTFEIFTKFKRTLNSYQSINVSEHETCEVIFLELMCHKFIKLGQYNKEKKAYSSNYDIEELAKIIENYNFISEYAKSLREIQNQLNSTDSNFTQPTTSTVLKHTSDFNSTPIQSAKYSEGFDEIFQMLNQLHMEEEPVQNLKSDTSQLRRGAYVLKNKDRIGVCCIINQEIFYPSQNSIRFQTKQGLTDRLGSTLDLIALEETMSSLKFKVRSKSNLNQKEVFSFIKEVISKDVQQDDSVFMLCILSHGVRGHVYAADSTKIKIEAIQNLLDSDDATKLHGMPKVLILQACQSEPEPDINSRIESDSPKSDYYLRKSHFLIYWATAPEYEAYRLVDKGTIFIQCLCVFIKRRATHEHLFDIFTKVTDCVTSLCTQLQRAQVPIFESTLRKKLYLT